jgi:hypothetical protein
MSFEELYSAYNSTFKRTSVGYRLTKKGRRGRDLLEDQSNQKRDADPYQIGHRGIGTCIDDAIEAEQ